MDLFRPEVYKIQYYPFNPCWLPSRILYLKMQQATLKLFVSDSQHKSIEANKNRLQAKKWMWKGEKLAAKNAKQIDWNRKRNANENDSSD